MKVAQMNIILNWVTVFKTYFRVFTLPEGDNLLKKGKFWITVLILLSILVGVFYYMQYASNVEKEEIVQAGIPIGQDYIRKYYNAEFIYKNNEFIGSYVNSTVYLHGYIKGNEGQVISIAYDYKKKEVLDVSGPDWFIDSRNPRKNSDY
ncbi:hypothetical protein [Paenibacillus polymyxa]|uniref:hypothetical protein n=1 Tax=Paenibacillus polymyxa TaxID=1406 RepID=UPI0020241869|nr:hypothetical protein [Paenibacillus polymyxa]URJ60105.1 hypothetical protein MF622_004826 [Paenibacillus polymyxa]